MKTIFALLTLVSFSAQAHFQIGTYKGVTPEGTVCSVEFEKVAFTTEFKHPLAERVTVKALDKSFLLQHLYKVDEAAGSVMYVDESLEQVIPFKGGAELFKVVMDDVGPTYFIHLSHDWKAGKITKSLCEKLVFQETL